MTIASSARKIIKTQRFIFRALPALLASVFVLNACSGAVPVTVNNSSDSNEEIAKLKQDATTADNRITELEEASRLAGIAKTTADNDIIRLKNEAVQAGIAKASADSEIIILQGQLATAIGERGTANGMITILQGQLQEANDNQNPDDSAMVTRLRNQLLMAINNKNTADMRITTLEGQLSTAMGNEQTASDRIAELEDAIQLIEDARITFIDWAGTAEEPKTTVKNAEGTGTEPLLNGAASVVDSDNTTNFIQGLPTLRGQGFDLAGTVLADARVYGDVLLLAKNSPSGVAFSEVRGGGTTGSGVNFYAGLLPTTNLGAPITDINTSVIWDAKVMLTISGFTVSPSGRYSNPDFKMQVIFDGSEGTINSGTLSGGVFSNGVVSLVSDHLNPDINIQGRFGSDGLLYGTVEFNSGSVTKGPATLTGLIGVDGAVGAFTDVIAAGYLAGGFVAYPTTTDPRVAELEEELQTANEQAQALRQVEYDNWEAGKTPDASPDTANPRYQFLQSRNRTLDTGTTTENESSSDAPTIFTFNTADFRFDGRPVSLDTNDGFATFTGYHSDGTNYGYIGILDTTDFGTPLAQTSTALIWNGSFLYLSTYTDFALTINVAEMGNGDIDAFFKLGKEADYNILLTGTFDAKGVITAQGMGSVFTGNDRDLPTGTPSEFSITGLIGADGALGIFSNENVGVGGFFVTPTAVPDPNVGYSKWVKALDLDIIPDTENPRDQYLLIRDGKINTGTTTDTATTSGTPQLLPRFTFNTTDFEYDGRPVGTDTNDGFTGFLGYHSDGTDRAYFSILDTTDLGLPLSPTSTSLKWNGSFLYGSARPTRADFTLTIDVKETGDGTIDAFFKLGRNDFYLLLTGGFDENGVITADAVPGIFTGGDRDIVERKILTLPLTGLIGADGAFAFYYKKSYAGISGFFVTPTAVTNPNVRYNNWVAAVNPDAKPVTASPANQFLQENTELSAEQSKLNTSVTRSEGPIGPTVTALNLDDNADNEVAFFSGKISEIYYYYAGVLSDVDVGLPLGTTFEGEASAEWGGKIQATNMMTPTDLTLRINFATPRIKAIVQNASTDNYYYLDGTYTPQGLITGTVNYGTFSATTLSDSVNPTPMDGRADNGVLTGLIGPDGAVGVFVSGTTTDGGITITDGTGATGFAGGFVAHPTAPIDPNTINFFDWGGTAKEPKADVIDSAGTGTLPLLNGAASVEAINPQGNFVQGLATVAGQGFDFAGTGLSSLSTEGDILLLGENSPSGVAYSYVNGIIKYYAGLLPTTNLGARITDPSTDLIWGAKFGAISVPFGSTRVYSNPGFKMQITFDGSTGTISSGTESSGAFTPGQIAVPYTQAGVDNGNSSNFNIQGRFGSDGLLYGTVGNNPLTGLIGADGAVGAFAGNQFAGGFVASPTLVIASNITIATWLDSFNPSLSAQPKTASPANQFLPENTDSASSDKLNTSGTRAVGSPSFFSFKPNVATLNLSGDTDNEAAFFSGEIGNTIYHYAGILSDVGVGLPIDATFSSNPTAEWSGKIQATNMTTPTDLTLRVGFATPSVKAIVQNESTDNYYYLDGTYSNKGVITGTVNYGTFSATTLSDSVNPTPMNSRADNGVLTGLIGQNGAVGVFVSGTTTDGGITIADGTGATGFAGGFVVTASE